MLVGDEDQLGTIIRGKYDIPDNVNNYYGSVLRMFMSRPGMSGLITQLNKCRRMNEVMTGYLAEQIYSESYTSTEEVMFNAISLEGFGNNRNHEHILDPQSDPGRILDPEYQLTVCYAEVIGDAYDKIQDINEAEKSLVADLTMQLQNLYTNEGRHLNFHEFWGSDEEGLNAAQDGEQINAVGIITPYNRLNEEIRALIASEYDRLEPQQKDNLGISSLSESDIADYIDCSTVDKFQGQERDVIIACYGERNIRSIMQIMDFVYNRNRLNVVISRAKKKCILILSDNLVKRHKECYESNDEEVVRGVEFMCGLKDYLKEDRNGKTSDAFGGQYKNREFEFKYEFDFDGKRSVNLKVFQIGYNPI